MPSHLDHLPEHRLNIILAKGKCEKLHDLIVGKDVRSLDEFLQHPTVTAKSVRPLGAGQLFYLALLDPDLVLVIFLSLLPLLDITPQLRERFSSSPAHSHYPFQF